ncbi:hypothetical protein [Alkalibaculum bacchi]|nr:hypothetical protein [Alkalibaculum bacchi]
MRAGAYTTRNDNQRKMIDTQAAITCDVDSPRSGQYRGKGNMRA